MKKAVIRGSITLDYEKPYLLYEPDRKKVIGRNPELIKRRNNALCHRYYFYYSIIRMRMNDISLLLSGEFYLSVIQIQKILMANREIILKLKKDKVTVKALKAEFPTYNWRIEVVTTSDK